MLVGIFGAGRMDRRCSSAPRRKSWVVDLSNRTQLPARVCSAVSEGYCDTCVILLGVRLLSAGQATLEARRREVFQTWASEQLTELQLTYLDNMLRQSRRKEILRKR